MKYFEGKLKFLGYNFSETDQVNSFAVEIFLPLTSVSWWSVEVWSAAWEHVIVTQMRSPGLPTHQSINTLFMLNILFQWAQTHPPTTKSENSNIQEKIGKIFCCCCPFAHHSQSRAWNTNIFGKYLRRVFNSQQQLLEIILFSFCFCSNSSQFHVSWLVNIISDATFTKPLLNKFIF